MVYLLTQLKQFRIYISPLDIFIFSLRVGECMVCYKRKETDFQIH